MLIKISTIKKCFRCAKNFTYYRFDCFIFNLPNWCWWDHNNEFAVCVYGAGLGSVSLVRVNRLHNAIFSHHLPLRLFIFLLFLQDLKDTPHYWILINKANGFGKSTAYIPEEEITIIMGLEVVFIFYSVPTCLLSCAFKSWLTFGLIDTVYFAKLVKTNRESR